MQDTKESLVKIPLINKDKPGELICLEHSTNQKGLFNEFFIVIGNKDSRLMNWGRGGALSPTEVQICTKYEKLKCFLKE